MSSNENENGSWFGLLFALGLGLALLALDMLWLTDYLEHRVIRGRPRLPTVTGWLAITQMAIVGLLGVGVTAFALYFIGRKLRQ